MLCKTNPVSGYTIGYRIVAMDSKFKNMTKVLVTSFTGHEDLIEYMSNFRSIRYYRKRDRDRFMVRGAMFWFPCNQYGERTNETPVFITMVPLGNRRPEEGKRRLEQEREKQSVKPWNKLLSDEPAALESEYLNVKKQMPETIFGRRHPNERNEQNECKRDKWRGVGF